MRLKKGFTLAEILIVLMVIGVIATLTVPSMMKGVQDAQYKTAFKKAYNTISNLYSTLAVEGQQPVPNENNTAIGASPSGQFFVNMLENLSVREITELGIANGSAAASNTSAIVTYSLNNNSKTVGVNTGGTQLDLGGAANNGAVAYNSPAGYWITTDDGISFTVANNGTCRNKQLTLASGTAVGNYATNSCLTIIADVNGVSKGPNQLESQHSNLNNDTAMDTLSGDQYYIFITKDGVTAGNKLNNAAARIIADVK